MSTKPQRMWLLGAIVPLVLVSIAAVALRTPTVMPGDQSNPKLVAMFNQEIDEFEQDLLSPKVHAGFHDGAAASGRAWLQQVDVVESYCGNPGRFAHIRADVRLRDGRVFAERMVDTSRCSAESTIEMRVRFGEGRVVDVQTDGSEKQFPPDHARRAVEALLGEIVQVDMDTNKTGYYKHAIEKHPSLEEQWAEVPASK